MEPDIDIIPSSPSNSSLSSSDLDTESTGSFFADRSTTLGTLMGLNFPAVAARGPRHSTPASTSASAAASADRRTSKPRAAAAAERRRRRHRGGRPWWRLCRDDMAGPTSLGEFLQVERRIGAGGEVDYVCGGAGAGAAAEHVAVGGGPLFEDGRVLPPAPAAEGRRRGEAAGRLPALLMAGICSGGEG